MECRQTLRKESSSRKPLRRNNINKFPSDNISKKPTKRKRSLGDEQVTVIIAINCYIYKCSIIINSCQFLYKQIPSDSSNIIYFQKDDKIDSDIQQENTYLPFCIKSKKFKSNKSSKTNNIISEIKNMKTTLRGNQNKQHVSADIHQYLRESSNQVNIIGIIIELYLLIFSLRFTFSFHQLQENLEQVHIQAFQLKKRIHHQFK